MTGKSWNKPVLPLDYNLEREITTIKGRDGKDYLQFSSHMVTFYKQTYGEHSRFFSALRDARLIGACCPECQQVMVPAATWHCPNCNFTEMEEIELPHQGVLTQTAPITIFPSSSFLGDAPFCRGYVDVATDAPIASFLPSRLRTTTGLERPGIFIKGTRLKLVFEDDRVGSIRDIFWVPISELAEEQCNKQPLFASELNFSTPPMPELKKDENLIDNKDDAVSAIRTMAAELEHSKRAQTDIAGRTFVIGIKTGGGDFGLLIADGRLLVGEALPDEHDFIIVTQDPVIFSDWVKDGSLTDAAVEGTLWLPNRDAFQVLPILDRLPRSIRRDQKEK